LNTLVCDIILREKEEEVEVGKVFIVVRIEDINHVVEGGLSPSTLRAFNPQESSINTVPLLRKRTVAQRL
jgi:hypothetical protein